MYLITDEALKAMFYTVEKGEKIAERALDIVAAMDATLAPISIRLIIKRCAETYEHEYTYAEVKYVLDILEWRKIVKSEIREEETRTYTRTKYVYIDVDENGNEIEPEITITVNGIVYSAPNPALKNGRVRCKLVAKEETTTFKVSRAYYSLA